MRTALQLAATLLLTGAAHAQISNPDKLISPPPSHTTHQRLQLTDDLQWLWPFIQPTPIGRADDLRLDSRFQSLVPRSFTQPQPMWGNDPEHRPPLAAVIPLFVTRYGAISSAGNRYISIDGCVPSFCSAAGLLWIDMGTPNPLMIFAATNWIAEGSAANEPGASYGMWLFPNRNLAANALPFALTTAIADWNARLAAAHRLVPHVAHALLVEPDGTQYPLDPQLAGANTIAPQPDTTTPQNSDTATQN